MTEQPPSSPTVGRVEKRWKSRTTQVITMILMVALVVYLVSRSIKPEEFKQAFFLVGINPDIRINWGIVGWVMMGVVAVIVVVLAIRQLRNWVTNQVTDVWRRVEPQVTWAFKHPRQLSVAIGGSVLQTAAFAGAFVCSLLAFGVNVDFLKVAAAYLVANALGSLIPVPGGVGSIEATLTVGMTAIGVPAAVALSAAVTFRLATFYLQIPIGWFAFQWLRHRQPV